MTEISDMFWIAANDKFFLATIGEFIKDQRISKNKSQEQLAKEAGISRSTLSLVENGEGCSLLVFIQIMRALDKLFMFKDFKVSQQISPLKLAKLEQEKRQRASRSSVKKDETQLDW